MVINEHSVVRSADRDDATALRRLYTLETPYASLLNNHRESIAPSGDELRELLGREHQTRMGALNAIEDLDGVVQGFCGLRSTPLQPSFGQFIIMLYSQQAYQTSLAREVGRYLVDEGFLHKELAKLSAQCLNHETGLRKLLIDLGFSSDGVQREMFYTQGRWLDLESFTLCSPALRPEPGQTLN